MHLQYYCMLKALFSPTPLLQTLAFMEINPWSQGCLQNGSRLYYFLAYSGTLSRRKATLGKFGQNVV